MGHHNDHGTTRDFLRYHGDESRDGRAIEACRRLVEEEKARRMNEGAGEGDSLTLTPRASPHDTRRKGSEVEAFGGVSVGVFYVQSVEAGSEFDVLSP
jgi:hypothetical protein